MFPGAGALVELCEVNLQYWRCQDPDFKLPSPTIDIPIKRSNSHIRLNGQGWGFWTSDVKSLMAYHEQEGISPLHAVAPPAPEAEQVDRTEAMREAMRVQNRPPVAAEPLGLQIEPDYDDGDYPGETALSSSPQSSLQPPLSPPPPDALPGKAAETAMRSPRAARDRGLGRRGRPKKFRQNSTRAFMPHDMWEPHKVPLTVQNHHDSGLVSSLLAGDDAALTVRGAGHMGHHSPLSKGML